jgi:hypothetical protein
VYTTGYFQLSGDFDPGEGFAELLGEGGFDIFMSKLDSDGDFVWANAFAGVSGNNQGRAIAVDGLGNVYATGQFGGSVDFDPGPGSFGLSSGAGGESLDAFVSKHASDGSFVWAKALQGTSNETNWGSGIAVDGLNNVLTTGRFGGTVDFAPGPDTFELTSEGGNEIFVSKLNSAGNFVCAIDLGDPGTSESRSIALDDSGNVHLTGRFRGAADFAPGPSDFTLFGEGDDDVFVVKLPRKSPAITMEPAGPFVEVGEKATLSLSGVVGAPIRWFKGDSPVVDDPPRLIGSETAVLTLDPAELGDSGIYHVTYDDGSKAAAQTPSFEIEVVANLPLTGIVGLALLGGMCGVLGMLVVCKRYNTSRRPYTALRD